MLSLEKKLKNCQRRELKQKEPKDMEAIGATSVEGGVKMAEGDPELNVEKDLRIRDTKALLELLEELVSRYRTVNPSTSNDSAVPTGRTVVDLLAKAPRLDLILEEHLVEGVPCSTDTSNAQQGVVSMSIECAISRIIAQFLGNAGLCRTCGTVQQFYDEIHACDSCGQHYCKQCYPIEPETCSDCDTLLCEKKADFFYFEWCGEKYHYRCDNALIDKAAGYLACSDCSNQEDGGDELAAEWRSQQPSREEWDALNLMLSNSWAEHDGSNDEDPDK